MDTWYVAVFDSDGDHSEPLFVKQHIHLRNALSWVKWAAQGRWPDKNLRIVIEKEV